jgi:hypothetical protein
MVSWLLATSTPWWVSVPSDQFKDLARQLRQEAEEQARRHGRELGAAPLVAV